MLQLDEATVEQHLMVAIVNPLLNLRVLTDLLCRPLFFDLELLSVRRTVSTET